MSQLGESSAGGRARSRMQGGLSGRIASIPSFGADPVGELSGFPLIPCSECGLARVVEGRTKKDDENHGRLYFKCGRNGYPKLCNYYGFEKDYFQRLKDEGISVVRPSNWAQVLGDQEEPSVNSLPPSGGKIKDNKLQQKMEALEWKINMFVMCVVSVVFGCVLMYTVMK